MPSRRRVLSVSLLALAAAAGLGALSLATTDGAPERVWIRDWQPRDEHVSVAGHPGGDAFATDWVAGYTCGGGYPPDDIRPPDVDMQPSWLAGVLHGVGLHTVCPHTKRRWPLGLFREHDDVRWQLYVTEGALEGPLTPLEGRVVGDWTYVGNPREKRPIGTDTVRLASNRSLTSAGRRLGRWFADGGAILITLDAFAASPQGLLVDEESGTLRDRVGPVWRRVDATD